MTHSYRRTLSLLTLSPLALAMAMSASAASRDDLHNRNVTLLNSQYKAAAAQAGSLSRPEDRHAALLGLDAESRLSVLTHNQDADGTNHYRYQQSFRGVPVWGEAVVVSESKDGSIKHLFGRSVSGLGAELPVRQTLIGSTRAGTIGRGAAFGSRAAQMLVSRENIKQMIFVGDDGRARMSYVVELLADTAQGGSPTRPFIIVDAVNGKILKQWEGLTHAQIGTGPGGNAKTGQYEWGSGGKYAYMDVTQSGTTCTMNNAGVKAVNLNGGSSGTTAFSYTCPRNTVKTINGAYSPLNDAMSFGQVITNMYPAYTGYNALSFQLVMRVHYSSNYENAFWDGSTMSFGDGASTFYPLVNADVSGHEVSHGFTEQHSNLTYSGQSGGINESFSDMGGEATEYYWQGSNDFLVGKEIFKSANGALRYMNNPPQDGSSIDNAANYTSGMDVHYSSGVYNKAFYLLATKPGWNVPTAFKVFARANALYWTSSTTYNTGACGVETAATDLGLTKADVTAAFTSVGVSCSGGGGGGTTTTLQNGVAATGIGASTGGYVKFKMDVPAGATGLKFVMSGGSGDGDMYVKFGSAPTDTSYDCRPYVSGNAETCTIATAQAGTYYVNIKAYSTFSGASLTGSYSTGGPSCGGAVLCNGVGVALPSVSTGGVSSNYSMTIAAGKTVNFTISGGTGDADMYVKAGSAPTSTSYNCRPYTTGNSETCTFTPASTTTYYINVRAYSSYSGVTLKGTSN